MDRIEKFAQHWTSFYVCPIWRWRYPTTGVQMGAPAMLYGFQVPITVLIPEAPRFVRIVISVWFHTTAPLLLLMSNFLSCVQVILWWRSSTSHGILWFCSFVPCFLNTCHALRWHLHPSVGGSPPVQSVKWSFRSVFMGVQPTPHVSDPPCQRVKIRPCKCCCWRGATWLGLVELPILLFPYLSNVSPVGDIPTVIYCLNAVQTADLFHLIPRSRPVPFYVVNLPWSIPKSSP